MMKRVALAVLAIGGLTFAVPRAQMRVVPVDEEQGHVALGLALRHLNNTGVFMMATAHPDDENNGLLVMLNRGQGYRTALATATRGNGGQNEIGPEIFEALGVLRTEELGRHSSLRRRGTVLHPRGRFRILLQRRRDVREVGARRDPRRLRAADSHDPPRRHHRPDADRHRRRPAPSGVRDPRARGVQGRGRSHEVSRADQRRAARLAAAEVLLHRRLRRLARTGVASRQSS